MEMKKCYWSMSTSELLERFGVPKEGHTQEEAQRILEEHGENVLREGQKKRVLQVFFEQFCDLLVIILIVAAVISLFSGNVESTVVILLVLMLNAVLGTVQHCKAQKSLESLKKLSSPHTKIQRDGQIRELPSGQVVPGDVVLLEAGDLVPADGCLLCGYSLQVNESSLTGESVNAEKCCGKLPEETPLAERSNMVYSGSLVTYGRAEILVTATGMDTEIGRIADLMNLATERKTPLQESLDQFSGRLAVLIMGISVVVFALSLYRRMTLLDSLMFAVALAVAAIPEALGSIVTIVQAFGTQKMAREHAIIKDLKAVESLGCVSVICSDKTGTLTQNKMTVQKLYADGEEFSPEKLHVQNPVHRYLLYDAVLANDATCVAGEEIGDPTETALLTLYDRVMEGAGGGADSFPAEADRVWVRNGDSVSAVEAENGRVDGGSVDVREEMPDEERCPGVRALRESMPRLEEIPFDSERKLMSTRHRVDGVGTVFVKGAVDVLLERCDSVCYTDGIREMTDREKERILQRNRIFSEQGLRVLAFAYKEMEEPLGPDSEQGFLFLGLIAMVDPPRPESAGAVENAAQAGIKTVMITGDHKETAVAIARQIGIWHDGDLAYTGAQLDTLTDDSLDQVIEKISVYARVAPEHKIRIVEAWQRKGRIVAMTGDGVNDAPALKKADVGIAMGITGTEVSKDAADMILSDDHFATIIKAVANGRNVYRNIKNAILFLLSGNTAAIFCVLYTSILGLAVPFAPVHLLFINLLTDSLPALAIGMEPADAGLLKNRPRDPREGILTRDFLIRLLTQGGLIAAAALGAYTIGNAQSAAMASTMAFATLTLARLFHGFNCRRRDSIVRLGLLTNPYSLYAFGVGAALLAAVLFVPPLQTMFRVVPVSAAQMGMIAGLAFAPTGVIQGVKWGRERW